MNVTPRTRQYAIFALLIASSALLAVVSYRLLRGEWIVFRKGETLFAKGDYRGAIPLLVESFRMGNDSPRVLRHLGDACVAAGRFPEAAEAYRTLLKRYPAQRSVRISLARALAWSGRFDEAVGEYRKVLGERP